jgi:ribonuclease P protein subunit RPR2
MNYEKLTLKNIAKGRMKILLNLAYKVFHKDPSLSRKYVELTKKIGMKSSVRLPRKSKMFLCKKCGNLLVPGTNCRVRIKPECGTKIIITCLTCKWIKRYPLTKGKKLKKIK